MSAMQFGGSAYRSGSASNGASNGAYYMPKGALLRPRMCPNNMTRSDHNAQVCFENGGQLFGVARGTIFGVNAASLNRWKMTFQPEGTPEPTLEPPFDYAGQSNYQLVLEAPTANGMTTTSPNEATPAQRAMGAMKCAPGTTPVLRGAALLRTTTSKAEKWNVSSSKVTPALQPVSIWQCEANPRVRPQRTRALLYA